ncbi:cellulose biosynthesis cyclic di-GMP-binding regulatory protein BcsB [Clostridium sp. JS66]|uniref:cellulose biosynthesis cyclic di-GMP-binding regulatory protein BcsB n=1 Tax=Clostridium sp. JS66 TaxID=3064705 RepID=UPI00298DE3B3|nr:cellulose biosynthesis cyclic di-GMP-binding regulatory protein BcsB [Clostridium sp. JS66]WPC43606.1 cellulose biosynthesis cyclic di-GMP-binding regulatory protein BcsB [Clostridium sp. JS66]
MYRKLKFKVELVIISLIIALIVPFTAFAAGDNNSGKGYDIQIFKDDQKLNLPKNTGSYWFTLPKGFNITDDSYIELHFTFSNTLISTRSNITMLINDFPVETKWTYDIQRETSGWWNVKLPVSKLKINGINELKFQSNQRSIEGDCQDIDNPSNWVVFHKDSKLHVTVNKYPDAILSNFYPTYYDNFLNDNMLATDFILPKVVDNNSICGLLKMCSSIGKMYTAKDNIDYNVFKEGDKTTEKNKVFIGKYSAFSNINNLFNAENIKLSNDEGYLSIKSENNSTYNTLVTGENDIGLNKAVDFISNNNLLNQVISNSIKVNSKLSDNKSIQDINEGGIYKFSDFGYTDINLKGAFHQKVDLSFVQPKGIQNLKGSYIELKFRHSKVLDSDRSSITVYINGMAVNSAKLTVANAEDGTLKINIPESALSLPEIKVSIECYNYLGKIDCSKDYYDSAWTVINSDSKVCLLKGETSIQPNLQKFPFFYTKYSSTKEQVAIGMGEPSNELDLKASSMIATRIGQNTGEVFNWDVLGNDGKLTNEQKKMNMVFLGSYRNAKIPESVKNELTVVPLESGNLDIKKGIDLVPEVLRDKVLFQVVRSPWDTSKRVYVILYDNDANLQLLNSVLNDRNVLSKLDGQVAVLDNNKEIHTITVKETKTVKITKTFLEQVRYIEFKTHLHWWMLLIMSIAIVAGVITIIFLHRSKNEFKKKGEKLKNESGFSNKENEEIINKDKKN